jgi:hypothetical protein
VHVRGASGDQQVSGLDQVGADFGYRDADHLGVRLPGPGACRDRLSDLPGNVPAGREPAGQGLAPAAVPGP